MSPVSYDANKIQLGSTAGTLVTHNIQSMIESGTDSGLQDGDRFTYTTPNASVTFELTTDTLVSDPNFVPIAITRNDTPDQIAQAIATVISANPVLGLGTAQSIGNGTTLVGGATGDTLTIDQGLLALSGTPGVSAGAFKVPFLPTAQFSSALTATALQAAIRNSTAGVNVFSPGAGTLLISGSQLVQSTFGGSVPSSIGVLLPAVSDLAGNAVRETRITDETRFTIIMPDVVFDYGDAPASYGTLDADNGARHTVADERLPRLGQYLDTETDGTPSPGSDDTPLALSLSETGSVFSILNPAANTSSIGVAVPQLAGGETLSLNVNGEITVFELTLATSNPAAGNVPVSFVAGDTASNIATNLSIAIRGRIPQIDESIIMTLDAANATITLTAIDDEDGISTGTFISNNVPIHLFTVPGTLPNNVAASDVIGFLNPLDPAGSAMAVSVIGSGLLDGWVDFDRNGVFESDEQVIANAAVVEGVNLVTFFAPANATAGDTWMRVRVSESGNLTPTGVSVGGEVEDFEITVKPIALPVPITHTYTAIEDTTLVVDSLSAQPDLFTGIDLSTQILPVRFFVGEQPSNGTLTVTDELSGEFTYLPNADFYGEDTFTYRLSTQQNSGPGSTTASTFATVTINVAPVNDIPGAVDQSLIGVEDTLLVIPAGDLLAGSAGHGNPAILTAPQNESDQVIRIASITAGGVSISNANQNSTATTTHGGTISAVFDAMGFITEVHYVPAANFNRDNLRLANGDPRLDDFTFTVIDDGALFLDDGSIVPSGPLTTSAQATIEVTPTNDIPTLGSEEITTSDARYLAYYAGLSVAAPVPTEDTSLVISGEFLLSNDFNAAASAADERAFINNNDGVLRIVSVSLADPTMGDISLLPNGDISFVPAPNVFGRIEFIYEVEDIGKDIAVDGAETIRPERESISSFIVLEPTNDLPVAYDRAFTIDEIVEPATAVTLPLDAITLINGAGVNANSPITINGTNIVVPDGATLIDGETLTLSLADGTKTIIEFNTSGTKSVGTDLLVQYTTASTADAIATLLETELRANGMGGTASANTIVFKSVASTATDTFTSGVTADAAGITVVDGASLTGGESVTVTDSSGRTVVFEFSETGFAVGTPDALVPYADADDSVAVANSLRSVLANNGFTSAIQAGTNGASIVQFVPLVVSVDNVGSQVAIAGNVLTVPDGTSIINGETITVNDGSGTLRVIEFNTTGTASAGTDFVVTIADTDLAAAIAANLAGVLQSQLFGATSNGAAVTFHNATSAAAAAPVTSLVTSASSVTTPAGSKLIDGETLTLTLSDNTPVVIEFNTTGIAATGTHFVIQYSPADIADSIATRVETALRADGIGISANAATLEFTSVNSIAITETPAAPGEFPATLVSPFNEDDQSLRIVQFATAVTSVDAAVDGDGTFTLPTIAGGTLTVTFVGGAFTTGFYTPATDYNEQSPFLPTDSFTYIVEDEDLGQTSVAGTLRTVDLPSDRSLFPGTVTITVTETNDTPTFTTPNVIEIAEDSFGGTVDNVIQNVLPSMATALDEIANQTVTFSVVAGLSNVPAGLMTQLPEINSAGGLTFYPAVDAVGTATYVIRGIDDDSTDARSTDATITVHVRPVNDAPRFNPVFADPDPNQPDSSDFSNVDDAWNVGREFDPATGQLIGAPITYTLREDNSQPIGSPSEDYFIPFRQDPTVVGYNRPGLLDVFVAGPGNELDGTLGGNQILDFFTSVPATTDFGGQLVLDTVNGIDGVRYTPPLNYNNQIGGSDSFIYTVRDNSTVGGETYNLGNNSLSDDRLTTTNTIFFDLNPVNDRPEFTVANPRPEASEDSGRKTFPNFAFDISAGPPTSAFDEVDVTIGQNVTFSLTSLAFPATQSQQFFTEFPTISPDGTLAFEAAPDVFGEFEFRVVLTDDGPGNATRGDLISSLPQVITVTIQPQNDAPVVDPQISPLEFTLREDGMFVIPVNGDTVTPGLLTPFLPGPANEAEDVAGGNQSVFLAEPITASTAEGGTLTQIKDANNVVIALEYKPRSNFVGTDSFIYTVTDDGISVDIGTNGVEKSEPKFASHIVSLVVTPINDEPLFSGAGNVTSNEDGGPQTVPSWATNVQAGPPTAVDEAQSQSLQFVIVQTSGDPNLFSVAPQAIVIGDTATLTYQSAPDANGVATFEAYVDDSGPNNAAINDDDISETKTFTIRVNAINDPPSFNLADSTFAPDSIVEINEEFGPYNRRWATDISPGPSDESLQTVRFEVFTPPTDVALFQTLPTIDGDGFLRFTPATNAVGTANLRVIAIDSENEPSQEVSLRIIVNEVNDVPIAVSDEFFTDEDTVFTITSAQLLVNDKDPDLVTNPNERLFVKLQSSPFSRNGASISIDETTGVITYDPRNAVILQALAPNQPLTDSFSYSVIDVSGLASDPQITSNPVTVSLNVMGINDKPRLVGDTPTLNANGTTVIRPLDNDTDIDGFIDPSSIQITLQPAFGSLAISNTGVITYTPFGSFSTEDTFRYTVADNLGLRSDQATITVSANAAPIARDDIGGGFIDETIEVNVAANDFDPDFVTDDDTVDPRGLNLNSIVIISDPANGSVVPLNGGSIRFVPNDGFVGTDQFQYAIADLEGRYSSPATVDIRYGNSRLQNPVLFDDVNADGDISPLDALLVINRLAEVGSGFKVVETDRGPNFYDTNGDQVLQPSDILHVLNALADQAVDDRGQGEQISSDFLRQGEPTADSVVQLDSVLAENGTPKIVAASTPASSDVALASLDFIDSIANQDDDDDRIRALDAAFGDLI
ncbi:MAG: Ig-like domain-containing protein [Pirellulaceae bacterium]